MYVFIEKKEKLSWNYPQYPILSGPLGSTTPDLHGSITVASQRAVTFSWL